MTVDLPIEDGPKWISHIEVTRAPDGTVSLRIVKHSGEDYRSVYVADERLRTILDLLS